MYYSKEVIPVEERRWNDVPAYKYLKGNTPQADNTKLINRLVRRYDQDERETDGAVHWHSMGPKLRRAIHKAGGQQFSDSDWL